MATDLRSVTECAIPQPILTPVTEFDPATAARIRQTGMQTFYGQFEHAPGLIDKWFAFYQPVVNDQSTLALRTKELCRLRIAARNGCMFCLGGRFRDAAGVPVVDDDDVDAVLGGRLDDARFTAQESAAMRFTEVYRLDHSKVDKALVDETLEHLSTAQFIELGLCIAQFTGMGQLFAMLGLPSM
ncbi:MAG: carboxymuconolactone decarboxylase family protein [Ilumatobacteraceae bacterium]|nr:carboxymuconolactone decarboxylase family protein [Ilumatobacteraceae bacterium]